MRSISSKMVWLPTLSVLIAAQFAVENCTRACQSGGETPFSQNLDDFAERVKELNLAPGFAVVVVRGDEVLHQAGYGYADIEADRQVTPETVFYIASSTKSFTGLAAALCAEKKLLELDRSLANMFPDGEYHPKVDPSEITLRQLLTHTHGISNDGPISFRCAYSGQHSPEQLAHLLRFHGPDPQGNDFRYGNIGYNIASMAMDRELKQGWKNVLENEIFVPLSMESTTGFVSQIDADRLAMPYGAEAKGFARVHYAKNDSNMHAAGGLVTTAEDLGTWLRANINRGVVGGKQLLPRSAFEVAQQPYAEQDGAYMQFQRTGYSLGWNTGTYEAEPFVHHFGGFSGFHAHVSFMPEQKIGVAILVNESRAGAQLADLVSRYIYDTLLDKPDVGERFSDESFKKFASRAAQLRRAIADDRARRAARPQDLPHPRSSYTGQFANEQFGSVTFSENDGKLEASMGPLWSAVEVYDGKRNALRIELVGSGQVVQFKFDKEDRAKAFVYEGLTFEREID